MISRKQLAELSEEQLIYFNALLATEDFIELGIFLKELEDPDYQLTLTPIVLPDSVMFRDQAV